MSVSSKEDMLKHQRSDAMRRVLLHMRYKRSQEQTAFYKATRDKFIYNMF